MIKVPRGTVAVTLQFNDLNTETCFQLNKLLVNHDVSMISMNGFWSVICLRSFFKNWQINC